MWTWSQDDTQAGLQSLILLPELPECWNHRYHRYLFLSFSLSFLGDCVYPFLPLVASLLCPCFAGSLSIISLGLEWKDTTSLSLNKATFYQSFKVLIPNGISPVPPPFLGIIIITALTFTHILHTQTRASVFLYAATTDKKRTTLSVLHALALIVWLQPSQGCSEFFHLKSSR